MWSRGTTDRVHPIHMIQIHCTRTCLSCHTSPPTLPRRGWTKLCHAHVNSVVCSGDSYKTESADDVKVKSIDTCTPNCELRDWNERETSEPLHTCTSLPVSPSWLSGTSIFLAGYITTTRAHCILDKTCEDVMHTGVHRPYLLT